MAEITLIMVQLFMMLSSNIDVASSNIFSHYDQNLIEVSSFEAIKSIKEADATGADVSSLVERFNEAKDLLDQAQSGEYRTCHDEECVVKANESLVSIVRDAALLTSKVESESQHDRWLTLAVYAPIAAFLVSICGVTSYTIWKYHAAKRFLGLEIHDPKKQSRTDLLSQED